MLPNQSLADRIKDTPTHRLVVYDLRGAWTKSNRNVALALFDTFMKTTVNIQNVPKLGGQTKLGGGINISFESRIDCFSLAS